jgi:hypothetical protein
MEEKIKQEMMTQEQIKEHEAIQNLKVSGNAMGIETKLPYFLQKEKER